MERTAFARALTYLNYSSRAKWLAIFSGIGTAIFYVLLVLVLALLVDLLVSRGRVPNFAQLTLAEQEQFLDDWNKLSKESRVQAIQHVGYGDLEQSTLGPLSNRGDDKQRFDTWMALTTTEALPPLPSKLTPDNLKRWAQARGTFDDPPYLQAMKEHELRWRAYVWHFLKTHIGEESANSYQPQVGPADPPPLPGLGEENQKPHGVLSLIVRLRNSFGGKLLGSAASFNPWMWDGNRDKDPNLSYLTGLLLLALLIAILRTACMMAMNVQAAQATIEAVTRLRRALYHHTSRLGDLALKADGRGEADSLATRHIESVHEALYVWLTTAFRYPAQIFLLLVLALVVQIWLALAIVLFALLVWLMGGQILAGYRRQGRVSTRHAAGRLLLLIESINIMRLVKSYLMELFNQSRVERQLAEYAKAHTLRYRIEAFAKPVVVLLVTLAGITLMYLAGRIVLSDGLSLAGLTVLAVAVAGLYLPVKNRFELQKHFRRGQESAALVFAFLEQKGGQSQFADAEFLQPMATVLEMKDIGLREPGASRKLLTDINLDIRAGEKIGIMGADENEKRALLYLILRFFDPTDGEIKIDGRNLRWVTLESLRSQIGIVMQNNLIFNDTVANNIGCGDPSITMPQIFEASKLAHAHQFITKLPYGYETPIGEMGHSLRVGEQFRIALARAILRDPAIYIIEEPLSVMDDDTKTLLDDTFSRILPGKTVFFLPHRTSTLKMCDRIVVMRNGSIEAIGTHRELAHQHSLYKHLYYLEFNAFAEVA